MSAREMVGAVENWIFDDDSMFIGAAKFFFVIAVVLAVIIAPFLVAESVKPTFTLRKDEWSCTASHREEVHSIMPVGKIMVPTTNVIDICDEYQRTG